MLVCETWKTNPLSDLSLLFRTSLTYSKSKNFKKKRFKVHITFIREKRVAEINFLCLKKRIRFQGFAMFLIQKITDRLESEADFQDALYTSCKSEETSFTRVSSYIRVLDPKKLVQMGYLNLGWNDDMSHFVRKYALSREVFHGINETF